VLDKALGIYIDRNATQTVWDMRDMHAHKSHEIFFLVSGQRRFFIGHTVYDVEPGDLVIIPCPQLHRAVSPRPAGYERYVCNFKETRIQTFINDLGRERFDHLLTCGCLQLPTHISQRIYRDLQQLEQELSHRHEYTDAAALHLLQDILLCALRYGTPKEPIHGDSEDKVQDLARYIARNYAQPITLSDAASMACMESTYFSKRFKALTGFGVQEYMTQTRLQAAEQLLRDTALSVGEIAEQCGFSSANYFGDVFRRWNGLSPTQYRKTRPVRLEKASNS